MMKDKIANLETEIIYLKSDIEDLKSNQDRIITILEKILAHLTFMLERSKKE